MEWTTRTRLIAIAAVAAVVVLVVVIVLAGGDDDRAGPEASPTPTSAPPGTSGGPPDQTPTPGVVARRWPVDPAEAERLAAEFAVPFSNHLPTGPRSSQGWLDSIEPHSTPEFVDVARRRFKDYWWSLLSGGYGAVGARVTAVSRVWVTREAVMLRVTVDREVKSFLGEPMRPRREKVSWDVKVISPAEGEPKVDSCVPTSTRPSSSLSDPYGPGEAEGE